MPKIKFDTKNDLSGTGDIMYWAVQEFNQDVKKYDDMTLYDFFYLVADLPYIADSEEEEQISRPSISMSAAAKFRDCDDKMVILGCALYRRDIPFYFVAVSEDPNEDYHHVVIEIAEPWRDEIDGKNILIKFLDPTYPGNKFGKHNIFYKAKRI